MNFCTKCGNRVESGLKFCTGCGAPVDAALIPAATEAPAAMAGSSPAEAAAAAEGIGLSQTPAESGEAPGAPASQWTPAPVVAPQQQAAAAKSSCMPALLIGLAVLALIAVVVLGAAVYAGYRVKQKATARPCRVSGRSAAESLDGGRSRPYRR